MISSESSSSDEGNNANEVRVYQSLSVLTALVVCHRRPCKSGVKFVKTQDQLKEEKRQKRIQIEKVDYIMHVVVTNDGHFVYIGS